MEGFDDIEIIEEIEPLEWDSDPILLEMIIQNLLENSVRFRKKFTDEKNFIQIGIKEVGDAVQISIVDNGIGIKNENLQHIYQMFSKAARDHQNLGLGLYIVKQAVQKLKGSISLKNNEEDLTRFEVSIPIVHHVESVYS
jgi:signal transduction histidine kinase